jgi:WD40 repeat protein
VFIAIAGPPQVMLRRQKSSTPPSATRGDVVRRMAGDLTTGEDNTVRLWDVQSGKELRRFTTNDLILSAAFSPDGKFVLTGSNDGSVQLWDADTSQSGTASPTLASATAVTPSPTPTTTIHNLLRS